MSFLIPRSIIIKNTFASSQSSTEGTYDFSSLVASLFKFANHELASSVMFTDADYIYESKKLKPEYACNTISNTTELTQMKLSYIESLSSCND